MKVSCIGVQLCAVAQIAAGCLPVHGDRIRGEDLAEVIPLFAAAAGQTVAPAPLATAERHFSRMELRRLALRLGLSISDATEWPDSVCFAYRTAPLARDQVIDAIRRSMSGEDKFELVEYSLFPVPPGDVVFNNPNLRPDRPDGTKLILGVVTYAPRRQTPIWARVRPLAKAKGLVAAQELQPGIRLTANQVRMSELDRGTTISLGALADIEGMTPRRRIPSGTPLTRNMLARSRDVDAGEMVRVKVQAGTASLSFPSRAETGGYVGDHILLRNPDSGQRFRAKVEGRARVSVDVPMKEN